MSSLLEQTLRLPQQLLIKVKTIYENSFPFDVRVQLAQWIEESFLANSHSSDYDMQNTALQLLHQLEQKILTLPSDPDNATVKHRLQEHLHKLRSIYAANLQGLYLQLKLCLSQEMDITKDAKANAPLSFLNQSQGKKVNITIGDLEQMVTKTELNLEKCKGLMDEVTSNIYHLQVYDNNTTYPLESNIDSLRPRTELVNKVQELSYLKNSIMSEIALNMAHERMVLTQILENGINNWKRQQQLSGNGFKMTQHLDPIQKWYECMFGIIWTTKKQINGIENINKEIANNVNISQGSYNDFT